MRGARFTPCAAMKWRTPFFHAAHPPILRRAPAKFSVVQFPLRKLLVGTLTKLGRCAAHLWRENGARRKISGCAAQIGAIGCAAQDRRNEGAPILRGAMRVRQSCAAHPRSIHRERSLPICINWRNVRCCPMLTYIRLRETLTVRT